MHIVQILPELNQGGVERGTVELSRELVKRGHRSTVISAGGKLAEQIENDGGRHITLDVCSKNLFTVPVRISKLRKILRELSQRSEVRGRKTEDGGRRTEVGGGRSEVGSQESGGRSQGSGVRGQYPEEALTTDSQQPATQNHPHSGMVLHVRSRVPAWLCWFANKKLKLPFVTTVHGFNSISRYSEIMTRGDRVICVSNPVKEYIQKNYGTPDEKITVIHRGIDPEEFDPEKLDQQWITGFKNKYDLQESFVVTAVGRITELKDYETFIRAVASCAKEIPNIKGVIVGGVRQDKQAYFKRLQALTKELGAEDRIVFAGSHSRMPEIYALSDLLVSSSKQPESFGRTLIEAMAMNTPVIAPRHGGALDIVEENRNGFLFTPKQPDELAVCIQTAQASPLTGLRNDVLSSFTLDSMVEKATGVYEQLAL